MLKPSASVGRSLTLAAAHDVGIVHRDLKPGNVKVTADGTVKVLDFGLAKAFKPGPDDVESASITMTGRRPMLIGTPAYLSPEQARGEAVGVQTDIWAFGALLYEMLTGRSSFRRIGRRFAWVAAGVAGVLAGMADEGMDARYPMLSQSRYGRGTRHGPQGVVATAPPSVRSS